MPRDKGIQLIDHNDEGAVMDLKIIPVRDVDGKITQGMVVGQTLVQNKALLLIAPEGDLKFSPTVGVGMEEALLGNDYLYYRHKIRDHYRKDGLKVTRLDFYENKPFRVDAHY